MWDLRRRGSSNPTAVLRRIAMSFALLLLVVARCADATQFDLHGPAGSSAFGTQVTVLPNGNIVVTSIDDIFSDGFDG